MTEFIAQNGHRLWCCWLITLVIIINIISCDINFFPHGLVIRINCYWYSGQAVVQVFDFLACPFFFHCFDLLLTFVNLFKFCHVIAVLLLERNKMIWFDLNKTRTGTRARTRSISISRSRSRSRSRTRTRTRTISDDQYCCYSQLNVAYLDEDQLKSIQIKSKKLTIEKIIYWLSCAHSRIE